MKLLSVGWLDADPEHLALIRYLTLNAARMLKHCRYSNLRSGASDRLGCLKSYPKWRDVSKFFLNVTVPIVSGRVPPLFSAIRKLQNAQAIDPARERSDQELTDLTAQLHAGHPPDLEPDVTPR